MQYSRYAFATVAGLFVLGVLAQFFLAGMAVFGAGSWSTHVDVGYGVAMVPVILLLLAWPARGGRSLALPASALLVVAQVQTVLPLARESIPVVAALHPVNALAVLGLGLVVARRGWRLVREPGGAVVPSASGAPVPAEK